MFRLLKRGERKPEKTESVRSAIDACCDRAAPATIMSPDVGVCCRGRFQAADGETVTLFLHHDWAEVVFMPLSLCCVTFNTANRAHVFLSTVRRYEKGDGSGPPRLVLDVPAAVTAAEARSAFRIPVSADSGLRVQLIDGRNRVMVAIARDISFNGMLVEVPGDIQLELRDQLTVELNLDGDLARLEAIVRRRVKGAFGLYFPQTERVKKQLDTPLGRIVANLERQLQRLPSGNAPASAPL